MKTEKFHACRLFIGSVLALVLAFPACGGPCDSTDDCGDSQVCWAGSCVDADYSPGPTDDQRQAMGEADGFGGADEPTEVGAVIDTFCGIPAYQNGPDFEHVESNGLFGYEYQCTELAYRFTCQYFDMCNKKVGAYGNAMDWYNNKAGDPVLSQMQRFPNGGTEPPRPGDILAYNNGKYGHVAIVKSVENGLVHVLEQNVYKGSHRYPITFDDGHYIMGAGWQGWMRTPKGPAMCGGEPEPETMPGCVTGGFNGMPTIVGNILHAEGTVGASKGLFRFSLVIDEQTVYTSDFIDPLPNAEAFSVDVDLSDVPLTPGTHTLALWVKDAAQCTGGAPADTTQIESAACVPDDHTVCAGGDVYYADSCGQISGLADECAAPTTCVPLSPTSASCQTVPDSCGNGLINPGEQCDKGDLGGATCESEGYMSGALKCSLACTFDSSGCCSEKSYEQCYQGDVYWFDSCGGVGGLKEDCVGGCEGAACAAGCSDTFAVTKYACPTFSSADGQGSGGGELMRVCGETDPQTGYMTIRARKFQGNPMPAFGDRPYQVRVSDVGDPSCGPATSYFVVSDSQPQGIGGYELEFTFPSIWQDGQTEKTYCVTASTKPGDPGYDSNDPGQKSWWWSEKVVVKRSCL